MKKIICISILLIIFAFICPPLPVFASSLINNPNITFSPDGNAFTTDAGETVYENLKIGYTIQTGNTSTIRNLNIGEHTYKARRQGVIPVGKWVVSWNRSQCIHNSYPQENDYHGVSFGKSICYKFYKKGWLAYCADCNDAISEMFIYMDKDTAESITDLDMSLKYYYLCPHCRNLEQGAGFVPHKCDRISWNRYKVLYVKNFGEGFMLPSSHMYNNETILGN